MQRMKGNKGQAAIDKTQKGIEDKKFDEFDFDEQGDPE